MVQFSPNNPYHAQTSMPNTSFNYVQNLPKNSPTVIINEEEQKALKEQKDQILKFALIPPVYFSVKKGVDLFQNACMGDYEKSLPYKLSNFGDKIANSSLVNSRFSNSIKTGLRNFKQKINNFINNSQILSTIKEMPANPENKNVIGFLKNQEAETASEFATCAKEFLDGNLKLKNLRPDKNEIDFLKNRYNVSSIKDLNNNSQAVRDLELFRFDRNTLNKLDLLETRLEASRPRLINNLNNLLTQLENTTDLTQKDILINKINRINDKLDGTQLSRIKSTAVKNAKNRLLKTGNLTAEVLINEPEKHIKEIIEVCQKNGRKAFGKEYNLEMFGNKLKSMVDAKTNFGKFLPKSIFTAMRGLIFSGGTFAILLFVAPSLAQSIVDTKNAKKGKKTATFADGLVNAVSWVVSIPLAIKSMFSVGGLKYLGMNKNQLNNYRNELKSFNQKAKNGLFSSKSVYKTELENLNRLKQTPSLGFFKNTIKKLANIMMIGHETPRPYIEKGKLLQNFYNKSKYLLKEGLAYPVRFGLYMMVFAPIIDKILSGCCHMIFGKPDLPEEKTAEEQNKSEQEVITNNTDNNTPKESQPSLDYLSLQKDNLIRRAIEKQITPKTEERTYSYIPSPVCIIKENNEDFVPDKSRVVNYYDVVSST